MAGKKFRSHLSLLVEKIFKNILKKRPLIVGLLVLALIWEISTFFLPPIITPPLKEIALAILAIFSDLDQFKHLLATGIRVLVALIVSFLMGALLGTLMGTFDKVREYAKPLLHFIH